MIQSLCLDQATFTVGKPSIIVGKVSAIEETFEKVGRVDQNVKYPKYKYELHYKIYGEKSNATVHHSKVVLVVT